MPDVQIIGASVSVQRPWLFSQIADSRAARRPVVLFVPEQYTLQAERDLMTSLHLPGLLNLDVISPTKLKVLVRDRAGSTGRAALDETGRAMAIHQALHRCGEDLVYYRRLGNLYGAVPKVDATLSALREEGLTPEALEEMAMSARGAAKKAKYRDLARIWREYDLLLQDRFDDPAASWRELCARLPASGLWQGADLYLYGFDTIRPDLREMILAAAGVCASIRVLLTMTEASAPSARIYAAQRESAARLSAALEERGFSCRLDYLEAPEDGGNPLRFLEQSLFSENKARFPKDPAPAISLYAASQPTAEALAAVSALRGWHLSGIPWNRMAIALPGTADASALLAALQRHHVPCFYSRKEPLSRHGVSRLLSAALACVSQGYATPPLLEIACSGFGVLSREDGAKLTEYVQSWGIDRGRWRKPFIRGENATEMEELRLRLLSPLDHLHDALRAAGDASACAAAVYQFLVEEDIHAQLQARRQRLLEEEQFAAAIIDRQVWDLLMRLLDQLHDLLGGRRATLKETALLLSGALERASLSALPEEEEGVLIGRIGHMLPGRTEALILLGMNEGVLRVPADSLLSDPERRALEQQTGKKIGLDQARAGMLVRSDYVRTMSLPEKRLWVSYCLRDDSGSALLPGEPVAELRRIFPHLRAEGGLSAEESPLPPDTPAMALERLGPMLRELRAGNLSELPSPWPDALRQLSRNPETGALMQEMLRRLLNERPPRQISSPTALRLFHGERVSISKLECYAACPWKHFLSYGLKPKLPGAFEFTASDAGTFFHRALQDYINQASRDPAWPKLPEDRVNVLMDDILDRLSAEWQEGPLGADASGLWQGEEYLRRARHAASVLTRFAANSDFQVLGTELAFGEPGGLPALVLRLPEGEEIALEGKIDRLDLYHGPEGDYLRVLDLKSREHSLEPARMDSGEQLQLMIYLQAALQSREGALPAGALYFPVQDKDVKEQTPEAAEAKRLQNVRYSGVALAEEDVIRAMDRDQAPYSLPKVFNQDGSVSKTAPWALPEGTLRRLMEAARRKAEDLCVRIRSGSVPASPTVLDKETPCTFCDFRPVCPLQKGDERPLSKDLTFAEVGLADAK